MSKIVEFKAVSATEARALIHAADVGPDLADSIDVDEEWELWRVDEAGRGYSVGDLVLVCLYSGPEYYSHRLGWTSLRPVSAIGATITRTV